jgi:hypothetical protein
MVMGDVLVVGCSESKLFDSVSCSDILRYRMYVIVSVALCTESVPRAEYTS